MAQQGRQAGEQGPTRGMIDGPLMLQYLLAMLNQPGGPRGGPGFDFLEGMGGAGAESGISMCTPESAPMASAVRSVSADFGGPMVTTFIDLISSLRRSRRRTASSTARGRFQRPRRPRIGIVEV